MMPESEGAVGRVYEAAEVAAQGNPELILITGIHGDEGQPRVIIDEHLARFPAPHKVHIADGHAAALETRTRGALMGVNEFPPGTRPPGVTLVYVREKEGGVRQVSTKAPSRAPATWREMVMLDLNRTNTELPEGSLQDHIDRLSAINAAHPSIPILRKVVEHPSGLVVSVHQDLERRAKYGHSKESEGAYGYASGPADIVQGVFPRLHHGMKQLRKHGFAVRNGVDDAGDMSLRKFAKKGWIRDIVGDGTIPDGSVEHFLAILSHRKVMANAVRRIEIPLVLTFEVPGLASYGEQREIVELFIEYAVKPAWDYLYPQAHIVQ